MHIEHQPTRGVSVPAVVVTRDGTDFAEVAGGCLVLLHFIAGDVLGDDFSCALQIAAFLADFHQQSTAFTGPFCSDRSEFALFRATQHDVHGNAECGIIHHDLHSGNFLVDAEDGAITAILDFSEGHYGMLVFDLAILLGSWAWNREGEGLDIDRCRQLLTTYQQRRPICAMDRALLPHALLLYFATDATGYLLPKLRESTLESLSQCNMYTGFYTLRENRSWMGELASLMDPASVGLS